jgi:hypothetical protein
MKQLLIQEADLRSRLAMDKAAEPFVRAGMNMGGFVAEAMEKSDAEKPNLIRDLSAQVKQLQDELNPVKLATETITNGAFAIGDAFSQAFTDVISGAKSTEQSLADTFESIGKAFLGMAAEIIAKQLVMIALQTILKALGGGFSFAGGSAEAGLDAANQMGGVGPLDAGMFGFRANGGPVNANQPYIVGERGPELFIPFQQGNITSNEELEAQMRETGSAPMAFAKAGADGKNGDDTISTSERRLLERSYADMLRETREERSYADMLRETESSARSIESMERSYADRLRETREERSYADRLRETREIMLPFTRNSEQASMIAAERETAQAISNPGPIDVRYESQVINGVEYITAEQHRKGMAQAAERGRALTLQALQNSVKTRSRVGI